MHFRACVDELRSCFRLGAGWTDAVRLSAATMAFHASKSGSNSFARGREFRIRGERREYQIRLRPRTGDIFILHEILTFKAYDLSKILQMRPRIRTVVDLGANIGLASLFFHDVLAPERLIAVEPVASNFALLQSNLSFAGSSIVCEHAAVNRTAGFAQIVDAQAATWGAQFAPAAAGPNAVLQTTVPDLMRANGLDRIDLLKIDVEGAEEQIFAEEADWLSKVGVVLAELHTDLAASRFQAAASRHGFRMASAPDARFALAINYLQLRDDTIS